MAYALATQTDAQAVAKAVEKYWALRGYSVRAEAVKLDETVKGDPVFTVHSDLVNGFPKDFPMTWAAMMALRAFGVEPREWAA
jgi:hypothetical protein